MKAINDAIEYLEAIGEGADKSIQDALQSLYVLRDELLAEDLFERTMPVEDIVSQYAYGKGGRMRFKDKVEAISERLEGTSVPSKYRRQYGSTYSKAESKLAGQRIAGAMAKREKMNYGGFTKKSDYYVVTYGYRNDDGDYVTKNSKYILATSEDEAGMMLRDQFEAFEGIPCDIIKVTKKS